MSEGLEPSIQSGEPDFLAAPAAFPAYVAAVYDRGGPGQPAGWPEGPIAGTGGAATAAARPQRQLYVAGGVLLIAALITAATVLALSSAAGDAPAATQAVLGIAASPSGAAATRLSTSSPASRAVTVSSEIAPDAGSTVFTDDFHDSKSGWATSTDSGMTFSFSASGYVIGSPGGEIEHHVLSPYRDARKQLSMSLTAKQIDGPVGLGFGVSCRRGQGAAQVTYSFLVQNDGAYSVERIDGDRSDSPIKVLKAGVASVKAGSSPITVVGMCASYDGGGTTRLIFFAEGQKLIDLTDSSAQSDSGWLGALVMVGGKGPSVMTAKHWQERDLSA